MPLLPSWILCLDDLHLPKSMGVTYSVLLAADCKGMNDERWTLDRLQIPTRSIYASN